MRAERGGGVLLAVDKQSWHIDIKLRRATCTDATRTSLRKLLRVYVGRWPLQGRHTILCADRACAHADCKIAGAATPTAAAPLADSRVRYRAQPSHHRRLSRRAAIYGPLLVTQKNWPRVQHSARVAAQALASARALISRLCWAPSACTATSHVALDAGRHGMPDCETGSERPARVLARSTKHPFRLFSTRQGALRRAQLPACT